MRLSRHQGAEAVLALTTPRQDSLVSRRHVFVYLYN